MGIKGCLQKDFNFAPCQVEEQGKEETSCSKK
nr:MAG TPA: hypothetical protein [Caudoviricetes sp.]